MYLVIEFFLIAITNLWYPIDVIQRPLSITADSVKTQRELLMIMRTKSLRISKPFVAILVRV